MIRPVSIALAAVAGALALSGCSTAPAEVAATPEWWDSPLEQELSQVYGTDDEEASDQRNQQVEYLTAACMADEGFDYTPDRVGSLTSLEQYRPDDPGWVARWGYGIVEYPDRDGRLTYYEPLPNNVYAASLSGSESAAYYTALYGDGDTHETWLTGCYGSSYDQVYGDDVTQAPANQPIMDAVNGFQESLQSNPDLAQIDEEWVDCMAAEGFTGFSVRGDAPQSIYTLVMGVNVAKPEELESAHRQEVELALADLACRQQVDYKQRYTEIQFAAETQFIDDHRAELDILIAQAQAARAAAAAG